MISGKFAAFFAVLSIALTAMQLMMTSSNCAQDIVNAHYSDVPVLLQSSSTNDASQPTALSSSTAAVSSASTSQCQLRPAVWNCPAFPSYTSSCMLSAEEKRIEAIKEKGWKGLSIQELEEFVGHRAHDLHNKLRAFFHRRRVVMVGDSLMRQWYETVSCRLGIPVKWYNLRTDYTDNMDPQKRLERITNASGVKIYSFSRIPLGYANASGYSMASTEVSNDNDNIDYCGFETKIEYLKYDKWHHQHNFTKFFDALLANDFEEPQINKNLDKDPLIIVNLGIHGAKKARKKYQKEVNDVMSACGALNRDEKGQKSKIRCIYRDIMPQHHHPREPMKEFPPNWIYNPRETNGCGPHDPNQNSVNFVNFEEYYDMAEKQTVPVVKILTNQLWKDAWNWHNDCTHFCMDPMLWDMLHWSFVELMEKENPAGFTPLI